MLQNIPKEKIIEVVRQGPTYPSKVAKQLGAGGDTMLVGAILSTLISSGDVKVSSLKVGGSPLYYVPDQESKLEDFLSYLNDKDKNTFRILKEKKVLQDSVQDPLIRVSLRAIKDFARPFEILNGKDGKKELFWRFYSISQDEAVQAARSIQQVQPANAANAAPEIQDMPEHIEVRPAAPIQSSTQYIDTTSKVEAKVEPIQQVLEPVQSQPVQSQSQSSAHIHEKHHDHQHHAHETVHHAKKKEPGKESAKAEKADKKPVPQYNFYDVILSHISSKNLDLISKEKIKKTEYDLVLKNHSNNEYIYCKAKDKSAISEGDLAPALIFAQNKKMPCLFLATGDLTKKAESMMAKEFSGMLFEKLSIHHV